jgi:hypothetical protein
MKVTMILPALTEAAEPKRGTKYMKIKVLFATLLTLALFTAGYAQTLDKAKLDQFFDRLAEKNKAMGSLTIAKDGKVLYTRAIGTVKSTEPNETFDRGEQIPDRFDHQNVHYRDDLATRRRRKAEADRHARQILAAGSERQEN